jgi:chemotaxis-related protein WspD
MHSGSNPQFADVDPLASCWNRIGVQGDRSCPKLAEAIHCRNCPVFSAGGERLFQREVPTDRLQEATRQLAEAEEATSRDALSLLVFRIGPEWLALEARTVVEVVETRPIHRIPHRTSRLLLGVANIRGELHLCISLDVLLDIESSGDHGVPGPALSARPRPRFLVVEDGRDRWVFPVDDVEGIQRVPAGAMEPLPHTLERSAEYYSQSLFSHEHRRIGMLSPTRLFKALERSTR